MAIKFDTVDAGSVTRPKRSDSRRDGRMREYDDFIAQVVSISPSVAKVPVTTVNSKGQMDTRGERLRVAQAITRYKKAHDIDGKLDSWTGPEGHVFVQYKANGGSENGNGAEGAENAATPATGRRRGS